MNRIVPILFATLILLSAALNVLPAAAQTEPPVVHAILFWRNGCPHCHYVIENVLPPLQQQYGEQLDILMVEIVSAEDASRLYDVAALYGIPPERVGVPFLVIGDQVLIGSAQIPDELPGLIEAYLAQGGVDWPPIPHLEEFLLQRAPVVPPTPMPSGVIVGVILFTTQDCQSCQLITAGTIGPLYQQYGEQLQVQTLDVVTPQDVAYLYQVAAGYGLTQEEVDLPLVIIGDHILIGEEIPSRLPALVEFYLSEGGVDFPPLPPRLPTTATPLPTSNSAAATRPSGFTLAVIILAFMAAALFYSLAAMLRGRAFTLPTWTDWLIPALIAIGVGIAAYLSYVETQAVEAVCGPLGDCNTVQQSRYATLFGFLPVGVFGLFGYLGLLAAWLARRFIPRLERLAALGFWGMAVFGVLFSFYLTYLEPFVIRAVCLWCLSSAVIMTLLLLLGTPPMVGHFGAHPRNHDGPSGKESGMPGREHPDKATGKTPFQKRIFTPASLRTTVREVFGQMDDLRRAARRGRVSKPFAEKLMLAVTRVNGCRYCAYGHTRAALALGVPADEIQRLMAGDLGSFPPEEAVGLAFAQHFAESRGQIDPDAWQRLVEAYGEETAQDILPYLRMITFGNLYGNTFDALLSRLAGNPAPGSSLWSELGILLGVFVLVPLELLKRGRKPPQRQQTLP